MARAQWDQSGGQLARPHCSDLSPENQQHQQDKDSRGRAMLLVRDTSDPLGDLGGQHGSMSVPKARQPNLQGPCLCPTTVARAHLPLGLPTHGPHSPKFPGPGPHSISSMSPHSPAPQPFLGGP